MNNTLSHTPSLSVHEQREALLQNNPDRIYGIYSLISQDDTSIQLSLVKDALCMYPNQFESIAGQELSPDIAILDINALRKGEIAYLYGSNKTIQNPILLSSGLIEIYGAKQGNTTKDHVLLTLRDGNGGADNEQYTSVAGRASGNDLHEEVEREQAEESPFLITDEDGNFALGVASDDATFTAYLGASIEDWIQKIKRANTSEDFYIQAQKYVKKMFPQVGSLENMAKILGHIAHEELYIPYEKEDLSSYPGADAHIKHMTLGDSEWDFFVFFDEANNTIEYRKMERITALPEGYALAGRGTSRLYLESFNQRPNTISRTNASKKVVPAVQFFVSEVLGRK